jgi:hypothetical protein
MTQAVLSRTLVLLAAVALAGACSPSNREDDDPGGGTTDGGPNFPPGCGAACVDHCPAGTTGTYISGVVTAPNGVDPVPKAVVYVPLALEEFPGSVACEVCGDILSRAIISTTTAADGSFTLGPIPTPKDAPPGQTFTIVSQKGRFRRVETVPVQQPCAPNTLPESYFKLPGRTDGQNTIPKIAVATGDYDEMECVLLKLGIENGAFDLYNGDSSPLAGGTAPKFDTLLKNPAKMKEYNIIFINCAGNTFESLLADSTIRTNINDYVNSGGRLYVTDWSYDYIEQIEPWAGIIDFGPGQSGATPEPMNEAAIGDDGITTEALVHDTDMVSWLNAVEARTGDMNIISPTNTVHIEHFLSAWVMQFAAPTSDVTKVWLTGQVSGDGLNAVLPLTTTHDVNSCGRWLYSSYHTLGKEALPGQGFPDYCSSDPLSPQERVLLYLIMAVADCIAVG